MGTAAVAALAAAAVVAFVWATRSAPAAPEASATTAQPSGPASVDTAPAAALDVTRPNEAVDLDALEIVTVLFQDAIPAIDAPQFVTVEESLFNIAPNELVIGVSIDGDARAYRVDHLSTHEIVNDVVGGKPIAVTW